eukprot:TRINITY_DN8958_c0_g1_i2.p2 TRINITY_DN8958_c0_g1~~TRINITY_DN8958_c0_g1_i2.p2  ORF type:complete len:149 (+),score=9.21 TRINITY_DN8958_c0_g1_i2:76-522(+)
MQHCLPARQTTCSIIRDNVLQAAYQALHQLRLEQPHQASMDKAALDLQCHHMQQTFGTTSRQLINLHTVLIRVCPVRYKVSVQRAVNEQVVPKTALTYNDNDAARMQEWLKFRTCPTCSCNRPSCIMAQWLFRPGSRSKHCACLMRHT